MMLGRQIDAVWHTGLVAFGKEYFFDGGAGIEAGVVGRTRFGNPLTQATLGRTSQTREAFEAWNRTQMARSFGPSDYHVLRNNCNHYTDAAAKFLCGPNASAPPEVMEQVEVFLSTPMGRMLQPMIENMMSGFSGNRGGQSSAPIAPPAPPDWQVTPKTLDQISDLAEEEGGFEALKTIRTVLNNIASHPGEAKYRTLRLSNERVQRSVGRFPGAVAVLKEAGFETDAAGAMLTFTKEHVSANLITAVSEGLEIAEQLQAAMQLSHSEHHDPTPPQAPQAKWRQWIGKAASNAGPAGAEADGRPLFIARSVSGGKCAPHLGETVAFVTEGNVETAGRGEYLVFTPNRGDWVSLTGRPNAIPKDAVRLGSWRGGDVYAGVGRHEGGAHPGMVGLHFDGCVIPFGGSGVHCWNYQIVVCKEGVSSADGSEEDLPVCGPLINASELLSFSPVDVDPALCTVPLRTVSFKYDHKGPALLVCHDMCGGYTPADVSPFGADRGDDAMYRMRHWDMVDVFVYFSHQFVTIPPLGWVVASHAHGVKCLGTLIAEGQSGADSLSALLRTPEGVSHAVRQMVSVMEVYGFDGWFINIEVNIPAGVVPLFAQFLKELTSMCHMANPASIVLNYDSVTTNGMVKFQNRLNEHNSVFFDSCDGIFTNYWWEKGCPRISSRNSNGRAADVYHGIDVFGRKTYGGGGFDCGTALSAIAEGGVSCALFAPGWSWEEHGRGGRAAFESADDRLWSGIRKHITAVATIASLPFSTTFNVGCGANIYLYGSADSGKWFDIASTTPLPVLPLKARGAGTLTSTLSSTDAYDGGSCLALSITGAGMCIAQMFVSEFTAPEVLSLEIVVKGGNIGLLLAVTEADGAAKNYVLHPAPNAPADAPNMRNFGCKEFACGGWTRRGWTLQGVRGVKVKTVSLVLLASDPNVVTESALGGLSIFGGARTEHSQLALKGTFVRSGGIATVRLQGFGGGGAGGARIAYADVFAAGKWKGRTHTGIFKAELASCTVCPFFKENTFFPPPQKKY